MLSWQELESACNSCAKCSLYETRTNVVFGVGNPDAEVVFIGEGPGADEDLKGEPFVGRAGKLLDDMLAMIGLDRSMIYIANMVKCRPPNNRDPLKTEQSACVDWLTNQLELINPKIIVCIGRISAEYILGRKDNSFKITKEHGVWYEIDSRRVIAFYHPAYLLRDPRRRPEAFMDLKELQRAIKELCPATSAMLKY